MAGTRKRCRVLADPVGCRTGCPDEVAVALEHQAFVAWLEQADLVVVTREYAVPRARTRDRSPTFARSTRAPRGLSGCASETVRRARALDQPGIGAVWCLTPLTFSNAA